MKTELIHEYKQVLKTMRKGTFAVKQKYSEVMRTLVSDMALLRCMPKSFSELNKSILMKLVAHWTKQKNTHKTIANKLSILRGYCRLAKINPTIPSNKMLGIQVACRSNAQTLSAEDVLNRVQHPIVKSIVEFQTEFGLHKTEAIKLNVAHINQNQLTISRKIAYNHCDRLIPITSNSQKKAISRRLELLEGKTCLTDIAKYKLLLDLHRSDLYFAGFSKPIDFRAHYSKVRFKALLQSVPAKYAYDILFQELASIL